MRFVGSAFVVRVLLALMLATFLSPSFGWHVHAGHHEIEAATQPHDHGHGHGDHPSGTQGDIDAHASIGHLLGHLPMQLMQSALFIPSVEAVAPDDAVPVPRIASDSSPPYRPPLHDRLA